MSEAAPSPAPGITSPPPSDAPKDAAPAEVVDPKAELNAALKKAGVKLKAKDKEYVPRDIDDLTAKAQRVYGLEAEMEKFKAERSESDSIKQWRAAVEADDDEEASRAFDALSPKAQSNAAKWLQRKAAAWEQERALPPETLEARRRAEELEAKLDEYRTREKSAAEEKAKTERVARLREAHGQTLKVAQGVVQALKASDSVAPTLVPLVARHMRVALDVAHESGEPVDEAAVMAEVQENVRADVLEQFSTVAGGMDDDALYDAMGETVAKRLMRVALRRRGQSTPTAKPGSNGAAKVDPKKDPRFGTPGYFR